MCTRPAMTKKWYLDGSLSACTELEKEEDDDLRSDGTFARKTIILWITLIALSGSCAHKPLAGTYRANIGDPRAGNSDKTDRRIVLRSDGTCSVTPPFLNHSTGEPLFEWCTYAIDHG